MSETTNISKGSIIEYRAGKQTRWMQVTVIPCGSNSLFGIRLRKSDGMVASKGGRPFYGGGTQERTTRADVIRVVA